MDQRSQVREGAKLDLIGAEATVRQLREMGKREDLRARLGPLLSSDGSFLELERLLLAESGLPGPRGNLELAWALADSVEAAGVDETLWERLMVWANLSSEEAPTGDPREFLSFCALQGLASLYEQLDVSRRELVVELLRARADDPRWRTREAVAMGFQRMAERDSGLVRGLFLRWVQDASPLGQRAIVAALAHPPILGDRENARFSLAMADTILQGYAQAGQEARKSEGFRVLMQGLEYALSVFVAHLPEEGFPFLARWAAEGDADLERIVRVNLGKARLAKRYPEQVQQLLALLGAG